MTYDIIIAGSGGGGMVAALKAFDLGLRPLIIEKSDFYGGSTALSGGGVWVPASRHLKEDGISDTCDEAISYLQELVGSDSARANQEAYVKHAAEMVEYIESSTHLRFHRIPGYADYYPDLPGGKQEGRTLEPVPFNGNQLGKILKQLNPPAWPMVEKFPMTGKEFHKIAMLRSTSTGKKTLIKILGRILKDKLTGRKTMTLGQAMVAALRLSLEDRKIPLLLNTGLKDLLLEEGKVVGAIVEKDGTTEVIKSRFGVLLATGGFAHNQAMRDKYQPGPVKTEWSLANGYNKGDGINIGSKYGAALGMMDDAWWGPVSILPDRTPFFHVAERAQPGGILVNKAGNRFINEAKPYAEFVHILREMHNRGSETIPCYFIMDSRFRKSYSFGLMPAGMMPKPFKGSDYMIKADSLSSLADMIDLPADALTSTVSRYNKMASEGFDRDFGKGGNAYDRYYGDPTVQPNPNMRSIDQPPFYAVRIYPGDLGTKGGLVTNEYAEVLRTDGRRIDGLYATGNTTSSVMGHTYPGAGATIGASMIFGYIAACVIAERSGIDTGI